MDRRFLNHPTPDGAVADGYAYLDGLSHDAYVSLCDEEAKLMPSPRTAKVNVAKLQLQQPQRPKKGPHAQCSVHPRGTHTNGECKVQNDPAKQIAAAPAPSSAPAPGASAPVACNLCSEPGHKSPACPFQADAKTAAAAVAKAARRKASAHAAKKKATAALTPPVSDVENSDGAALSDY